MFAFNYKIKEVGCQQINRQLFLTISDMICFIIK